MLFITSRNFVNPVFSTLHTGLLNFWNGVWGQNETATEISNSQKKTVFHHTNVMSTKEQHSLLPTHSKPHPHWVYHFINVLPPLTPPQRKIEVPRKQLVYMNFLPPNISKPDVQTLHQWVNHHPHVAPTHLYSSAAMFITVIRLPHQFGGGRIPRGQVFKIILSKKTLRPYFVWTKGFGGPARSLQNARFFPKSAYSVSSLFHKTWSMGHHQPCPPPILNQKFSLTRTQPPPPPSSWAGGSVIGTFFLASWGAQLLGQSFIYRILTAFITKGKGGFFLGYRDFLLCHFGDSDIRTL